jgi:HEAT repeat protein
MKKILITGLFVLLAGCAKTPVTTAHGESVSHWVEVLQGPNAKERKKAVHILSNVGTADPAVLPALTRALQDRDAEVRGAAALALLQIGPDAQEAIPALTVASKDRDPKVRSHAAQALEKIQTK